MEKKPYDPYYRDLPSYLMPVRTPFTRSGQHDAGHLFFYLTNRGKRWSLLLNKERIDGIYPEARQYVPRGISQFWLLEKRYSTSKPNASEPTHRVRNHALRPRQQSSEEIIQQTATGQTLIVLREPEHAHTRQSDILSYHFTEADAVAAAESYTRRHDRRAVVGLLLWDEPWWWE
jgi:hypothetical protein